MQPARMPSSVEPKASASEVGVRYPSHARCRTSRGRRTSGQPHQEDVLEDERDTTVANAGARIAAMTTRRSVGRAGTSLVSSSSTMCRNRNADGQQPVGQAAAEQRAAVGQAEEGAQRRALPVEIAFSGRGLGKRSAVRLAKRRCATRVAPQRPGQAPKTMMPTPSSPGTTPGAVDGGMPSDSSRSIIHEP